MKHRWMIPALAALAFQSIPVAVSAQVTIGVQEPNLAHRVSFGTVGQTFTVPWEASVLTDFTFWVTPRYAYDRYVGFGPEAVFAQSAPVFRLFVTRWDETAFAPTGGVLFGSEARTGRTEADGTGSVPYSFSTGGLELDPGSMYLAFLSTNDDPQPEPVCADDRCDPSVNSVEAVSFPPGPLTPYEGGALVGLDFETQFGGAGPGDQWIALYGEGGQADARFSATFEATAAPEPASMALLGTGLAGLVGAARRRRRKEKEQD